MKKNAYKDPEHIFECKTTKWCVWSGPLKQCVEVDPDYPECYDPACPMCGAPCEPRLDHNEQNAEAQGMAHQTANSTKEENHG